MKSGEKINRLTLIKITRKSKNRQNYWLCKCDCGIIKEIRQDAIGKKTKSCGCILRNRAKVFNFKHGDSRKKDTLYHIWTNMLNRCYNENLPCYKNYGGRGIKVYEGWREDYASFKTYIVNTLGKRPSKLHTIDRIDNDIGYFPKNIRWATKKEQALNRRKLNVVAL